MIIRSTSNVVIIFLKIIILLDHYNNRNSFNQIDLNENFTTTTNHSKQIVIHQVNHQHNDLISSFEHNFKRKLLLQLMDTDCSLFDGINAHHNRRYLLLKMDSKQLYQILFQESSQDNQSNDLMSLIDFEIYYDNDDDQNQNISDNILYNEAIFLFVNLFISIIFQKSIIHFCLNCIYFLMLELIVFKFNDTSLLYNQLSSSMVSNYRLIIIIIFIAVIYIVKCYLISETNSLALNFNNRKSIAYLPISNKFDILADINNIDDVDYYNNDNDDNYDELSIANEPLLSSTPINEHSFFQIYLTADGNEQSMISDGNTDDDYDKLSLLSSNHSEKLSKIQHYRSSNIVRNMPFESINEMSFKSIHNSMYGNDYSIIMSFYSLNANPEDEID